MSKRAIGLGTPDAPWEMPVPAGPVVIEAVADAKEANLGVEFREGETVLKLKVGCCIRLTRQNGEES